MAATVPTTEPLEARAGLTWAWTRSLSDYPASAGWTLTYWLKRLSATGANFSIVATASGADYAVSVSAATTSAYTADEYSWVAVVSKAGDAYEVDRGTLEVLPRYDQAANLDDRSHARKMLDAIEAVLENRATSDVLEYTIGQRSLRKMEALELTQWRDHYAAKVAAEERATSGQGGSKLVARL